MKARLFFEIPTTRPLPPQLRPGAICTFSDDDGRPLFRRVVVGVKRVGLFRRRLRVALRSGQ